MIETRSTEKFIANLKDDDHFRDQNFPFILNAISKTPKNDRTMF